MSSGAAPWVVSGSPLRSSVRSRSRAAISHRLAGSSVTLETGDGDAGCPGDTVMTVYRAEPDGSRVQVGYNDDDDDAVGLCSHIVLEGLEAGDYDLVIHGHIGGELAGQSSRLHPRPTDRVRQQPGL